MSPTQPSSTNSSTSLFGAKESAPIASGNLGSLAAKKKIPRPPNSFLIYRNERVKSYAGLVAPQLSTMLAEAWNNETPERRQYYAGLALKVKEEHAAKYPNWKFSPRKRGTGKRALALAAMANAAKQATNNPATGSSRKKVGSGAVSPSLGFAVGYSPGGSSNRNGRSSRPRRSAQRPRQSSSTVPHTSATSCPAYLTRISFIPSGAADSSLSSSHSSTIPRWDDSQNASDWNESALSSPTSSTTSCPRVSPAVFQDTYECTDSDLDDLDADGTYGEDDSTQHMWYAFGQLTHSADIPSTPPPPYTEEPSLFAAALFPSLLSMESFEPECLARDDTQWDAAPHGLSPVMTTSSMSSSSCSSSSYRYSTPSYNDHDLPIQYRSTTVPLTPAGSLDNEDELQMPSASLSTPGEAPLYSPADLSSQETSPLLSFPFEVQPMVVNEDLTMSSLPSSPTLTSNSVGSPSVIRAFPETQAYLTQSAIEWV
ncbi:hypothetical protein EDD11_009913 [Mortierella claussenii]|nr:hypothetical protein EDD11_009913 [Mortierella claussenii]